MELFKNFIGVILFEEFRIMGSEGLGGRFF
jgi:hypothetical protein